MTPAQKLPEHIVMRRLARAGGEKQHGVLRLDRIEREMPGNLFAQDQAIAFAQEKQSRREKWRLLGVARRANQDDVELQPAGVLHVEKLVLFVENRATDGIRPAGDLGVVTGPEMLF